MSERTQFTAGGRRGKIVGALSAAAIALLAFTVGMPGRASASPPTEFHVPSLDAAPVGVAAGPGGTWFVENTGFALGRIDSSGNVTEYPVPANSQHTYGSLNSITAGPDGAMWFTDESSTVPRVGRIDPSTGAISMFELPLKGKKGFAGAQPLHIVTGPDGALWFNGFSASVIGRVDVTGHFTKYKVSKGGDNRGIAAGPDGGIWFTNVSPDLIGRLDPTTGVIKFHRVPSALGTAAPSGITAGPDGALWFTESGTSLIGRIDPITGKITTVATPTANAMPLGITTGPDGAVWFTEGAAGNVGRVDPSTRVVSEYPLSSGLDAPLRITPGSDGGLWVSEAGADLIARIDPSNPPSGSANQPSGAGVAAAQFEGQCPVTHLCMTQVTTGGSLRIKTFTQQLPPGAIRLTGFLTPPPNPDGSFTLYAPVVGNELDSQPVPVSGGLIGTIPALGPILAPIVGPIVGPLNDLSVSLTLAGPVTLSLAPLGATVPVTLHLNNLALGTNCTIGPVVQHLVLTSTADGSGDPGMGWRAAPIQATDHTFSVPGAQGCGPNPLIAPVVDLAIDVQLGLPSASGNNAADLPGILSSGPGAH